MFVQGSSEEELRVICEGLTGLGANPAEGTLPYKVYNLTRDLKDGQVVRNDLTSH